MNLVTRRSLLRAAVLATPALPILASARAKNRQEPKAGKKAGSSRRAGSRGTRLKPAPVSTYASGQTPAERQRAEDARLTRECKGRPNAGACLGYAR